VKLKWFHDYIVDSRKTCNIECLCYLSQMNILRKQNKMFRIMTSHHVYHILMLAIKAIMTLCNHSTCYMRNIFFLTFDVIHLFLFPSKWLQVFSVVIFFWSFGIIDASTIKCWELSTAQAGARGREGCCTDTLSLMYRLNQTESAIL
jgi:hypothetical protein